MKTRCEECAYLCSPVFPREAHRHKNTKKEVEFHFTPEIALIRELTRCECGMAVEHFLEPTIRVCREPCVEDHVPSGHHARMSSQKNSEVTHKREVEDQGMEHHEKSTSAPQHRTLPFYLSLNSNRDSRVISYTMLFLQRRGLTVLLPSHSWGRGRSLSSSACSGFFLHSEDVDMAVSVHTPARPRVSWLCWSNRTHLRFSMCL